MLKKEVQKLRGRKLSEAEFMHMVIFRPTSKLEVVFDMVIYSLTSSNHWDDYKNQPFSSSTLFDLECVSKQRVS